MYTLFSSCMISSYHKNKIAQVWCCNSRGILTYVAIHTLFFVFRGSGFCDDIQNILSKLIWIYDQGSKS